VISFFTPDYGEVAGRLEKSLKDQEVEYQLTPLPPFRNWLEGVGHKAKFILSEIERLQTPVVWIDSDAVVHSYPSLFDELEENSIDFAAHFRNDKRYRNELLSGTLFFNYSIDSLALLRRWIEIQRLKPDMWDQRTLQEAVESTENLSVYRLPSSYTQIFDTMKDRGTPVIEHFQASRGKDKTAQAVNMIR
jgi:hypothetical protein